MTNDAKIKLELFIGIILFIFLCLIFISLPTDAENKKIKDERELNINTAIISELNFISNHGVCWAIYKHERYSGLTVVPDQLCNKERR